MGPAVRGDDEALVANLHVAAAAFDRAALRGGLELDVAAAGDRMAAGYAANDLSGTAGITGQQAGRSRALHRRAVIGRRRFLHDAVVARRVAVVAAVAFARTI